MNQSIIKVASIVLAFSVTEAFPAERREQDYDRCGPFELNFSKYTDDWTARTAQLREFIWLYWYNHKLGRAAVNYHSREGAPTSVVYWIEPRKDGRWNVVIEKRRISRRDPQSADRLDAVIATTVERIRPRETGMDPIVVIPNHLLVSASHYELIFRDESGNVVREL